MRHIRILPIITVLAAHLFLGGVLSAESARSVVRRVLVNGQELTQLSGLSLSNADIEYSEDGTLHIRTQTKSPPGAAPAGSSVVQSVAGPDSMLKVPKNPTNGTESSRLTGTYWLLVVPEAIPPGLSITVWVNETILDVFGSNSQQVKDISHLLKQGENTLRIGFNSAHADIFASSSGTLNVTLAQGGLDPLSQELKLEYPILNLVRKGAELPGPEEYFKFGLPLPNRR